jgi:3-deoxy-D-manno-octulosonic-acid transferase
MNLYRLLYNVAMLPLVATVAPLAYLSFRLLPDDKIDPWRQRLGYYSPENFYHRKQRPLVWIHAVSVGEVGVATALIDALDQVLPGLAVVLSTTTKHGRELARSNLAHRATCIFYPLDFLFSVHRALHHIRPDLIVCLETELWPNFLGEAHRAGIPAVLLNGRISENSFRRYRKIRGLTEPMLKAFSALAMVSESDARRIVGMGAPASKVVVSGNMKGAGLVEQAEPSRVERLRQVLQLQSGQTVLVAGSIRKQELVCLPEIYSKLSRERSDLVGIFAPRHTARLARLEGWFKRNGFKFQRFSSLANGSESRETNVILVDRVGVLFELYGLADLVFCGGSLVPLGGQNILEPAAWGKTVFYGPHMDNFTEARRMLEAEGCGITVRDRDDLLVQMRHYLNHLEELERVGRRGRAAMGDRKRLAIKQAELVREVLDGEGIEHEA